MTTILYTDLPVVTPALFFKSPVDNKSGGKSSYLQKSEHERDFVYLQLASQKEKPLKAPFGISEPFDKSKMDSTRKTLDLTYNNSVLEAALYNATNVIITNTESFLAKS